MTLCAHHCDTIMSEITTQTERLQQKKPRRRGKWMQQLLFPHWLRAASNRCQSRFYESHRQPMGGEERSVEGGVAVEDPSFCEAVG